MNELFFFEQSENSNFYKIWLFNIVFQGFPKFLGPPLTHVQLLHACSFRVRVLFGVESNTGQQEIHEMIYRQ
jgi:hypothetical protein